MNLLGFVVYATLLTASLALIVVLLLLSERGTRAYARRRGDPRSIEVTTWFYGWPLLVALLGIAYSIIELTQPRELTP